MTAARLLRIVRLRARTLLRRRDADAEIDREFAFHLEQLAEQKLAEGLSPDAAWRAARREFGNAAAFVERARDARGFACLDDLAQDARYGWRILRRSPGFLTTATLALGLGIGANAAVGAALATAVARPLPFLHADRLVAIRTSATGASPQPQPASLAEYLAWRQRSRALEGFGASRSGPRVIRTGAQAPVDRVQGQACTPGLFTTLGVRPAAGRLFAETTNPYGKEALVVLISHRLWQQRFGGAADTVGQTMTVDGASRTIVGIMPPDFRLQDDNIQLWIPLVIAPNTRADASARQITVTARLTPGATLADAQADLDAISTALAGEIPTLAGWRPRVIPLRDMLYGWTRPRLLTLQVSVAAVWLLTCANLAALLLGRGATRQREMAMRLALGASRSRLARQLLAESLLIGAFAGAAGLVVARVGLSVVAAALGPPPGSPRLGAPDMDASIAAATILLGLASSAAFGWLPGRAIARLHLGSALTAAAAMARVPPPARRWRGALVIAQVAAAEVLLIGAVLLGMSFLRLNGRPLNFEPRGLLTFSYGLRPGEFVREVNTAGGERTFDIDPAASETIGRVYERLRGLPGAQRIGGISYPPVNSITLPMTNVHPFDRAAGSPPGDRAAAYFLVTPHLFAALQTPVVEGREFDDADTASAPWGAIVNQSLARLYWPGETAIGKRLQVSDGRTRTVIGVVADIPTRLNWSDPQPVVYASFRQQPARYRGGTVGMFGEMTFVVRGADQRDQRHRPGDPGVLLDAARRAVAAVRPDVGLVEVGAIETRLWARQPEFRNFVSAVVAFAVAATLLAVMSLYAVMAGAVTERAGEIAIRKALGARPRDVVVTLGRPALLLGGSGLALGAGAALALTSFLAPQLWGIAPRDPAAFVAAAAALLIGALGACALPVSRALAIDPARRLRCE